MLEARANRARARARLLGAIALCLLVSIAPRAAVASNVITDRAGEDAKTKFGFEFGPAFSLPLPAANAHRDVIGLDAGLSCTAKPTPSVGFGADVVYHYWPVSAEWKRGFNQFLGRATWNTLMLGGGTWGLQVVEIGGHVRFAAPATRGVRTWLEVGASAYRVDPNTSGYSGDAGFLTVEAPPLERTSLLGYSVALGADRLGGRFVRLGLDARFHFVDCSETYGGDLHVITLGAHALFGR